EVNSMFRDKKIGSSPAAAAAMLFFGCVTAHPGWPRAVRAPMSDSMWGLPARPQWFLDRAAPDDDQSTRGAAEPGARAHLRQEPVCQWDRDRARSRSLAAEIELEWMI